MEHDGDADEDYRMAAITALSAATAKTPLIPSSQFTTSEGGATPKSSDRKRSAAAAPHELDLTIGGVVDRRRGVGGSASADELRECRRDNYSGFHSFAAVGNGEAEAIGSMDGQLLDFEVDHQEGDNSSSLRHVTEATWQSVVALMRTAGGERSDWDGERWVRIGHLAMILVLSVSFGVAMFWAVYSRSAATDFGPIPFIRVFRWLPLPLATLWAVRVVAFMREAFQYCKGVGPSDVLYGRSASVERLTASASQRRRRADGAATRDHKDLELESLLTQHTAELLIFLGCLLFLSSVLPPRCAAAIPAVVIVWSAASVVGLALVCLPENWVPLNVLWRKTAPDAVRMMINFATFVAGVVLLLASSAHKPND